jgi:hypothetical protein
MYTCKFAKVSDMTILTDILQLEDTNKVYMYMDMDIDDTSMMMMMMINFT